MLRTVMEGSMGDLVNTSDRRIARRFPVQGGAVFYAKGHGRRATVENLSATGALVSIAVERSSAMRDGADVSVRLGIDSGRLAARAVRIEHTPRRTLIALAFEP